MIFLGITTTLFFIDVILVLIGCKKNIYSLTKYAKPFICPLILTECILVLTPLLPDSKNIMLMLSISLACSTAGSILADYITKRICILAGAATFTAAGACSRPAPPFFLPVSCSGMAFCPDGSRSRSGGHFHYPALFQERRHCSFSHYRRMLHRTVCVS